MKIICNGNPKVWAVVNDVWSKKRLLEFSEALSDAPAIIGELPPQVQAFYRKTVNDCHLIDVDGNEYRGIDDCLAINFSQMEFDIAIEDFWMNLPTVAFNKRRELGNGTRLS